MAVPTERTLKLMFERLFLYLHENQQPKDLKRPLPKEGAENIRARVFAAGAAMAILAYSGMNKCDFKPDFVSDGTKKDLEKNITMFLEQDYYARVAETYAVSPGQSFHSDASNRAAYNAYIDDLRSGWNVQLEELKSSFPNTIYPDPLDTDNIGPALKLTKAVVNAL